MVKETESREETLSFGKELAKTLRPFDVLALDGPLGAGKTTLIQGIAEGLGIKDYITSPTFILINEYQGKTPFYHIDLYRLNDCTEIEDTGILEYFEKEGITVIEWASKMANLLPKRTKYIRIEPLSENGRKIII